LNPAIEQLIKAGENERVEFTSRPGDADEIAQAVCGLLNASGGVVIVGVGDDGTYTDDLHERQTASIENLVRKSISPAAMFSTSFETVGPHSVISIEVPSGPDKPYVCDNRIYVRVGAQTVAAQAPDARDLISRRQPITDRWERRKALGLTLEDLDGDLIQQTISSAFARGYQFRMRDNIESCLEDLGLLHEGQLTNGADVLFGSRVAQRLPQTRARALKFAANKASDHIDERLFEGPAAKILDDLMAFARRHVEIGGQFVTGVTVRQVAPHIPFEALREGLVNAIVHRDYAAFSGGIALRIYPNRVEIWNSGHFPDGYKTSDLRKPEHPSVLVNPDISMAFYLRGLMEQTGRGAYTIIQRCIDAGLKEPVWDTKGPGVLLKLDGVQSAGQLSPEHREILSALQEGLTTQVGDWPKSERTIRRRLAELVQAGYLVREGNGRATRYVRTGKPQA
jgi:ATP-dependent DNA helicase RecG